MRIITGFLPALAILAPPAFSQQQFAELGKLHLPTGSDGTHAVAMGDVDGDGDLDLLCGNGLSPGQQNRLYLNDGIGRFTDVTAARMPPDYGYTRAVAMGDVDGDGDLDLVFGNTVSYPCSQHRLYLNDGRGQFTDATATQMPATCGATSAVALGDVDGDGDLDMVLGNVTSPGGSQNHLYVNDGTGTFTDATAARLPTDNDDTFAVALGDVDGDGDLDLVCGNGNAPSSFAGQQNRLYLNDGNGRFTDATAIQLPWDRNVTRAVAMGDVDGDGDVDVVFANAGAGYWKQNRLCLNDGAGRFKDLTVGRMPKDFDYTHAVAMGDADGDGDLDLIFGNSETTLQDRLYLNDGTGTFTDASAKRMPVDSDHTVAVGMGDVDGDGDLDLVLGNTLGRVGSFGAPQSRRLYLNDGNGTFNNATTTRVPADSDPTLAVAPSDVDGDGDVDLVLGNGGQNRLYLNDGSGQFTDDTGTRMPTDGDGTSAVAVGDVDGDRDFDLVFGNAPDAFGMGGQNRLYLNDGKGKFTDATTTRMPADSDRTSAVAVGDVDGDGDPDLVFGNYSQQNRLYLNDGTGKFTDATATRMPTNYDSTTAVAAADVDGDGDVDLLFANFLRQNRLYLNDGTGRFTDASASRMPIDSDYTDAVAVGDVDGDGDIDLVFGDYQQNRLYLNDGNGHFTDATTVRMPMDNDYTDAVAVGDVDRDGDLDLVFGNYQQNRLYLNDGNGHFTDATTVRMPADSDSTYAVVLSDVDGDGDPDLMFGNYQQNRLHQNLLRQLDSPFLVIPGREYRVAAYARYGTSRLIDVVFPYVSLARAHTPLPPFGTLGLQPATMIALPPFVIPQPAGVGSAGWTLPNAPALIGRSIYAQALQLQWPGPAFLTNVTSDRFVR